MYRIGFSFFKQVNCRERFTWGLETVEQKKYNNAQILAYKACSAAFIQGSGKADCEYT